jgi:hypothetical protein
MAKSSTFSVDTIVTSKEVKRMRARKPRAAATPKSVNYTPEQTASVLEMFAQGMAPAAIGEALGKSARSIIAKLSREKNADGTQVYTAKTYKTKAGDAVVKKEELADKLTTLADLTAAEADSLTKANKTALAKIVALLEPGTVAE